jgi:geranylgeranyl pyrophosphate synthase
LVVDLMVDADTARLENELARLNAPIYNRLKEIFSEKQEPAAVYGLLSEFLLVEGKGIRPALCLLSCEAVGGKTGDALKAATAIEMFHNFTLIHDDIEDCSEMRRGKPCMHIKYGIPLALNAGDGLFMMVWREALSIQSARRDEAQKRLLYAFTEVLEGQALELGWHKDDTWNISEKEYLKMVGGKTGALIAVSCEVGALLGGADKKTCEAMSRFGAGIGMSFQIIDDVLNIIGDEKKYRKEIGGDIREGKRTLITMWALQTLPGAKRARLGTLLKKKNKSGEDVAEALALLHESGAPEKALKYAKKMVDSSLSELDCLPDNEARRHLAMLAEYITKRER